jgi:class 3 adenylate cyclase
MSEAQGRGRGKTELAIAFTDLVDFSSWALTAGDTMAVELLRSAGDAIEAPVSERGGTVVKRLGDGMMAVFPNVDRAVGAILEGRQRLSRVRVPNYKPRMRAGIHLGRPRKVGGDYFGVDVNVAARVAEAASAGELLLSASAAEALESDSVSKRGKAPIEAKGVPEGLKVYAVTRKRGKRQPAGSRARKASSSSKRTSGSSRSSSSSRKRATR